MCLREKKSAQIREILISESAWEEITCLFAPSLANTFLPFGSRFLIAFNSVKLAPGYTDSCSLILPG